MKTAVAIAIGVLVSLLSAPAHAAVTGTGFTEQILSCTGSSSVTLTVKKNRVVMLRAAPECDPMTPMVFRAVKDRKWFSVMTTRGADVVEHRVRVDVT